MYNVCSHIKVNEIGSTRVARAVARLPDGDMRHLLSCLPPDPLPEPGGYIYGSMRIAIQKILNERRSIRARRWQVGRQLLWQWLPFITLAVIILVRPRNVR